MKKRVLGEQFYSGVTLLETVADPEGKCVGCYFYHLCKAVTTSGYAELEKSIDRLQSITGLCEGVKFIKVSKTTKREKL